MRGPIYRARDGKVGYCGANSGEIAGTYASRNCCGCTTALDPSEDIDCYFV